MASLNGDSRFARITSRIEDIVVLNVFFVLCCLPVVTIGASLSAMYTVLLRMLRKEYGRVRREFLRAFRENFRQATANSGAVGPFARSFRTTDAEF